jgi:hypothetical protein
MTVEMALPRMGIFCILQMTNGPVRDRHLTKALTERQDILISLVKNYLNTRVVPGARHGPNVCPFDSNGRRRPDGMLGL